MILRAPTVRTNEYTHTSVAVNSGLIVSLIHTFATENCLNACTCMGEEEEKPLLFCFPNNLFICYFSFHALRAATCLLLDGKTTTNVILLLLSATISCYTVIRILKIPML